MLLIVLTIHSVYSLYMCKYARKVHIRGVGQGHIFIALLILVEKKKLDMSLTDFDIWNLNTS